uniref:Uncharacterized protein n=1 Tax=Anguilla anguilla TaxID=7936 RepID=A0A0E9RF03_ANGAN
MGERGWKWSETDKLRLSSFHPCSKLVDSLMSMSSALVSIFVQSVACPFGEKRK